MKYKVLVIGFMLALGGCAPLDQSSFEEAYIVDHEFGQATQAAIASQIAYPDRQSFKSPEGTEGINAEEIMNVYNQTFAEEPEQINIMEFGLAD